MADMRTAATALEAYAVDANNYPPNDGVYNVLPVQVTTPVAYITSSLLVDPFGQGEASRPRRSCVFFIPTRRFSRRRISWRW